MKSAEARIRRGLESEEEKRRRGEEEKRRFLGISFSV